MACPSEIHPQTSHDFAGLSQAFWSPLRQSRQNLRKYRFCWVKPGWFGTFLQIHIYIYAIYICISPTKNPQILCRRSLLSPYAPWPRDFVPSGAEHGRTGSSLWEFFFIHSCFWSCMVHFLGVGSSSGWWFGTFFPYIGNNHPNWLIFVRGVETTNQISCVSCFNLLFSCVFVLGDRFWVKWSRIGCVKKLRTGIQFLLAKSSKSIPVLVVLQSLNNSKDISFSELL